VLNEARVVIIGGGVAGCSLLYHLTKLGWNDVVLVEANELTSGSTWHAAGLCTQFNSSYNLMGLLKYSLDLYNTLGDETGQPVDFHECGSIRLALTQDRMDEYHHRRGIADALGVPFEIVSRERAQELHPLADMSDVLGAAYTPTDGYIDPTSLTHALAIGAQSRGAEINRHTRVTAIEREGDHWRVHTSKGEILAHTVVNAAGQWAREVGRLVGVEHPIVPLEHHYLITEQVDALRSLDHELPVLRDPEASYYLREEGGGLRGGPNERGTKPGARDGIPPSAHGFVLRSNGPTISALPSPRM
jgi:dimethylglycine dehydrogenase